MFGLTTTRRLQQETDALRAENARLLSERDTARKQRDEFQTAARTSAEKYVAADAAREQLARAARYSKSPALVLGDRLIEGGRTGAPINPATVARRERDRARALEQQQLAVLQAVNERCTCGVPANPHTPRICACGHGVHAHTVPAPHSCTAFGQTCPCTEYRQLPHDQAVAQLERNRQAAADRERQRQTGASK